MHFYFFQRLIFERHLYLYLQQAEADLELKVRVCIVGFDENHAGVFELGEGAGEAVGQIGVWVVPGFPNGDANVVGASCLAMLVCLSDPRRGNSCSG